MEKTNSTIRDANRLIRRKAWRAGSVIILSLGGLLFLAPLLIGMAIYFIGIQFSTEVSWAFVIVMGIGVVVFLGGVGSWINARIVYKKQLRKVRESSKDAVVENLIKRIQNEDFGFDQAVITVLGELEDKKATLPLISVLHNDDVGVREKSARALFLIKDERAGEALWAASKDEKDDKVRMQLAIALGNLNWQPGGTDLEKAEYFALTGRWDEVIKLGEVGMNAAIKELGSMLKNKDKWVRFAAIGIIEKFDDLRVITLLTEASKDADGEVRSAAKSALKKIKKT